MDYRHWEPQQTGGIRERQVNGRIPVIEPVPIGLVRQFGANPKTALGYDALRLSID
jgi:hypothetical protein